VSTGTLAATETGADTLAGAGAVLVAGFLAATETGSDTAAMAGNVLASGSQEGDEASPHGRIRRARHAADFQPDWLLEALNPPKPPRRARKRREEDLVMLA
jgi:hypothetical protein